MLTQLALAFAEGIGLVVSPTILPILPIIFMAGLEGGRRRPYGVVIGFVLTLFTITLLLHQLVFLTGLTPGILRVISYYLIFSFGIILIFDRLSLAFDRLTDHILGLRAKISKHADLIGGFKGGALIGCTVGLIWALCSGSLLAAAVGRIIRGQEILSSISLILVFSIGLTLAMLSLTLVGRSVFHQIGFILSKTKVIRRFIGSMIILSVVLTGAREMMWWSSSPTSKLSRRNISGKTQLIYGVSDPYPAPSLDGIGPWFNSPNLTMKNLEGKVVLINFWTYSNIHSIRTLPYLTSWDSKYRKLGLVIIGIHTPEFDFEKRPVNVESVVTQHYIQYAVALDNSHIAWKAFNNHYWPAYFLIDKTGKVVYVHYGEGNYDITENNIRFLLGLGKMTQAEVIHHVSNQLQTPDTYLGTERSSYFSNKNALITDKAHSYEYPGELAMHHWTLKGKWLPTKEYIEAQEEGSSIKIRFAGKRVFLVLSSSDNTEIRARVLLDGYDIGHFGGRDVQGSILTVNDSALYRVVNMPHFSSGLLEIIALDPGLRAFVFTVGS